MNTYSTCADCGDIMQIVREDQAVSSTCPEPRDYVNQAIRLMQEIAGGVTLPQATGTTDTNIIHACWKRNPQLNIGLPTGGSEGAGVWSCWPSPATDD